jgi:hypothetical protein
MTYSNLPKLSKAAIAATIVLFGLWVSSARSEEEHEMTDAEAMEATMNAPSDVEPGTDPLTPHPCIVVDGGCMWNPWVEPGDNESDGEEGEAAYD